MMIRAACAATAIVSCWLLSSTSARDQDRFLGMDQYIQEAMEKWEVPGLAIAVVKNGEVAVVRSYGVMEVGSDRRVSQHTVFPIASCTKSFTAAAIALLVDEKAVDWDDTVKKHLPEF